MLARLQMTSDAAAAHERADDDYRADDCEDDDEECDHGGFIPNLVTNEPCQWRTRRTTAALSRTEGFGCILVVKLPLELAITPDRKTLFVAKYWRSHCGRVRSHTNTRSGGLRGRPQGMWP